MEKFAKLIWAYLFFTDFQRFQVVTNDTQFFFKLNNFAVMI